MARQVILNKVAAADLAQVQGDFESEGALVVVTPADPGFFRLVITFP